MNAESISEPNAVVGKLLAVLSVATFWLVPFSPFVAIAAVLTTRKSPGWQRSLSRTGAILSVVCTVMFAALFLWMLSLRLLNGSWSF